MKQEPHPFFIQQLAAAGRNNATFMVAFWHQCSGQAIHTWVCNLQVKVLHSTHAHTHTHNNFTDLFPGPPGWAGARRELLDFMVQAEINRGRDTDHPSGRHSIRTNQCPPPPSPHIFYGPDALTAAQPIVSKHWRQLAHSDQGEDARVLLNGVSCTISVPYFVLRLKQNMSLRRRSSHPISWQSTEETLQPSSIVRYSQSTAGKLTFHHSDYESYGLNGVWQLWQGDEYPAFNAPE